LISGAEWQAKRASLDSLILAAAAMFASGDESKRKAKRERGMGSVGEEEEDVYIILFFIALVTSFTHKSAAQKLKVTLFGLQNGTRIAFLATILRPEGDLKKQDRCPAICYLFY